MSVCLNPDCIQECGILRRQVRDLQRTVAFFASVIKSGESWSEDCEKAWPVTLEPCVHDFHRAEHGMMPCVKCGVDAPPAPGADALPCKGRHTFDPSWMGGTACTGCGAPAPGAAPATEGATKEEP